MSVYVATLEALILKYEKHFLSYGAGICGVSAIVAHEEARN